jgi:sugar/nucleoside kinase (ribokinase family)
MNLSAPFLSQFFKEQMDETAPYWDFIFGNETEAVAWAKSHGHEVSVSSVLFHNVYANYMNCNFIGYVT